jgi:putative protease
MKRCAVQHVKRLTDMGIHSLKIEGRTKSHYYVARTAQVYRRAIDEAVVGNEFNMEMMDELEALANRGYTEGFYRRHLPAEYQNYEQGHSKATTRQFAGEVISVDCDSGMLTVDVKNHFRTGDQLELMDPSGNYLFTLESMQSDTGVEMDIAPGSGHIVRFSVPDGCDARLLSSQTLIIRCLPQT